MNRNTPPPRMTKSQARQLWKSLTPQQKAQFNDMYGKLLNKELMLNNVLVDDNEQIQRVILEDKVKPSAPDKPFYEHFHIKE